MDELDLNGNAWNVDGVNVGVFVGEFGGIFGFEIGGGASSVLVVYNMKSDDARYGSLVVVHKWVRYNWRIGTGLLGLVWCEVVV